MNIVGVCGCLISGLIGCQLSGYVAAVEVQDFQAVTEGQIIARIDDRQYRQRLAQAQAAKDAAQAVAQVSGEAPEADTADLIRRALKLLMPRS